MSPNRDILKLFLVVGYCQSLCVIAHRGVWQHGCWLCRRCVIFFLPCVQTKPSCVLQMGLAVTDNMHAKWYKAQVATMRTTVSHHSVSCAWGSGIGSQWLPLTVILEIVLYVQMLYNWQSEPSSTQNRLFEQLKTILYESSWKQ